MSGTSFAAALYLGTAVVAVWVLVRYPRAAPSSLAIRAAAPFAATFALQEVRIDSSTPLRLYATVFLVAFPILVAAWLSALWVLQSLAAVTRR